MLYDPNHINMLPVGQNILHAVSRTPLHRQWASVASLLARWILVGSSENSKLSLTALLGFDLRLLLASARSYNYLFLLMSTKQTLQLSKHATCQF